MPVLCCSQLLSRVRLASHTQSSNAAPWERHAERYDAPPVQNSSLNMVYGLNAWPSITLDPGGVVRACTLLLLLAKCVLLAHRAATPAGCYTD